MLLTHKHKVQPHPLRQDANITELHEVNHQLLMQLLDWSMLLTLEGCQQQAHTNGPVLYCQIRERFKYTTELSMHMEFTETSSDPLIIRIYHDAQLAELVYANEFEKQYRQLGGKANIISQASIRFSQNCFLNKWLFYLQGQGFKPSQWQPVQETAHETN